MEAGKHKYARTVYIILGLISLFLIIVWARSFYGSMEAYKAGETYFNEHKYIKAINFFDRSIHWYTPFNPYVRKSAERLWEIGDYAEQQGDIKLALIAFRTIAQGFHAASSFYVPGRSWIKKCELKISTLLMMEKKERKGKIDFKQSDEKLHKIQKSVTPSIFWSIIAEIGFLGWIGSVIGFIMFVLASDKERKKSYSAAFIWIALALIFFPLWIIGMMKA